MDLYTLFYSLTLLSSLNIPFIKTGCGGRNCSYYELKIHDLTKMELVTFINYNEVPVIGITIMNAAINSFTV